jgi:hypothetical protein
MPRKEMLHHLVGHQVDHVNLVLMKLLTEQPPLARDARTRNLRMTLPTAGSKVSVGFPMRNR